MSQTLEFGLKAAVKGGTTAAFKTMADAFKGLGKEMKETAKELYKMGKTDTADSLGHVSMAVSRVEQSFRSLSKTGKDTTKQLAQNSKGMKDYSKDIMAVQDAWKVFSKGGTAQGTALKAAESWTNRFSTALGNLRNNMIAGGMSAKGADSWLGTLDFSKVMGGMKTGDLRLIGSNLEDIRGKGYATIGMTTKMIQSMGAGNKAQTMYNQELERAKGITSSYSDAVKSLGKTYAYNNEQSKVWIPALKSVQTAMERTRASAMGTGIGFNDMTKGAKLATITQEVLKGNLKATSSGFTILNEQGLKAFSGLSITAADRLGMLSRGFTKLGVKEGATSLTAFGKAEDYSIGKTDKFAKSVNELANKFGVNSQQFQNQIADMKISDNIWNKHVTTLQKTGKISDTTASKMVSGFNASAVSSTALATALQKPQKEYEEIRRAVNRVSSITGQSTAALYKEAEALKAQKKPHDDVVNAINSKISTYKQYSGIASKIETQEKALANASGGNLKAIQSRTKSIVDSAKSDKELVELSKNRLQVLQNETARVKEHVSTQKKQVDVNTQLRSSYADLTTSNLDIRRQIVATVKAYGESKQAGDKQKAVLKEMAAEARATAKSMSLLQRITSDLWKHIKSFASYAAAATFISGLVGGLAGGMQAIIDFDQSLKDLQAITGATDREVTLMGGTIKQVASDTKFSATEIAEGMKTLGQAGLSAQESIQTIGAVSNLATGTLTDMATSVDLVTTAMTVFKVPAEDSAHVADVLANAANKSKLTIEKLRVALNYVGPVAALAGISFEETAGAMMTLSNSGMRASTIGTGFRQVLQGLAEPTDAFKRGVANAGLTLEDFNPSVTSMGKIVGNLGTVVTTTEKAFSMFGIRGAAAVLGLTLHGEAGFNAMTDAASKSGTAVAMASIQMEGLGVKIKNMYDKFANLAITMGEGGVTSSLGFLVDIVRKLTDGLTFLAGSPLLRTIFQVGALSTAVMLLVAMFTATKTTAFGSYIASIAMNFGKLTVAVNTGTAALAGTKVAMGLTLGWIGLIVAALAALVVMWNKSSASAKENFDESKNIADQMKSASSAITAYKQKIAGVDQASQSYRDTSIELKTKLMEVANSNSELSNSAYAAAQAIHPMTGAMRDSGAALEKFRKEADELELKKLTESFKAANQQIEDSIDYWARAKNSVGNFGDKVKWMSVGVLKNFAYSITFGASETSKFGKALELSASKIDRTIEAQKELSDVLDRLENGTASYEDLKVAISDTSIASTSMGKNAKKALDSWDESAKATLVSMEKMQKIDMRLTTEQIVELAIKMKLLSDKTGAAAQALTALINAQKAASSGDTGVAAAWGKDLEKRNKATVPDPKEEEARELARQQMADFKKEELKEIDDHNKEKDKIADLWLKARNKKDEILKAHSTDSTEDIDARMQASRDFIKEDNELTLRGTALNVEINKNANSAVLKADLLLSAARKRVKGMAEAQQLGGTTNQDVYLRKEFETEKAYIEATRLAKVNASDPKDVINNLKKFKESEESSLASSLFKNEQALADKKITKAKYDSEEYRLTKESYERVAVLAKRSNDVIKTLEEEGSEKLQDSDKQAANKAEEDSIQKLFNYERDKKKEANELDAKIAEKNAKFSAKDEEYRREALAKDLEIKKRVGEAEANLYSQEVMNNLELERMSALKLPTELARIEAIGEAERKMDEEGKRRQEEYIGTKKAEYDVNNKAILAGEIQLAEMEKTLYAQSTMESRERVKEDIQSLQEEIDEKKKLRGDAQVAIIEGEMNLLTTLLNMKIRAYEQEKAITRQRLIDTEEEWKLGIGGVEAYIAAIKKAGELGIYTAKETNDKLVLASDDLSDGLQLGYKRAMLGWKSDAAVMAEIGEGLVDRLSGIGTVFNSIVDGSKTAKEAFADFARSTINWLLDIISKQLMMAAIQKAGTAFGFMADGGLVPQYADGGRIGGYSRHDKEDNVHIMATANEFMQPVRAVKHYGLGFMEAVRTLSFPKNAYSMQFPKTAVPTPASLGFADGGPIPASTAPTNFVGGDTKLQVVNVLDKNLMGDYMSSASGQTTLINMIRRNGSAIRTILGG